MPVTVRLHPTSVGADPASFVPGRDLVLHAPAAQGLDLPWGCLIDDLLDQRARAAVDADALERQERWLAHASRTLTVRGVPVTHIWWNELLAEVFLPTARVVGALRAGLAQQGFDRLVAVDLDAELVECLRASLGVPVTHEGEPAPPPSYPTQRAIIPRHPVARVLRVLAGVTGIPGRPRGDVHAVPYWHLVPYLNALVEQDVARLLVAPDRPPPLPRSALLRSAREAGWLPYAGGWKRLRSHVLTRRAATSIPAPDGDALDVLCHRRAVRMVVQRATQTVAEVEALRWGLRGARLAVLPNDAMPDARVVVEAARGTRVQTMVVQHGFYGEPNEPDKALADHVVLWSEHDVEINRDRVRGEIHLIGNPGAQDVPFTRAPSRGVTLVLVEGLSRHSTRADERIGLRHVKVALEGLQRARPGTRVILRPHPSEPEPEVYARLGGQFPELETELDSRSPIHDVIARADLCVGAVSTATLQAGVAGVPVVFLNAERIPRLWPFGGGSEIPTAHSAEELASLIPAALASEEVRGLGDMRDALGIRPDALERLLALTREITTR